MAPPEDQDIRELILAELIEYQLISDRCGVIMCGHSLGAHEGKRQFTGKCTECLCSGFYAIRER